MVPNLKPAWFHAETLSHCSLTPLEKGAGYLEANSYGICYDVFMAEVNH